MRFSIRRVWGVNKYHAEVGAAIIEIRPRSLLSNTYQWRWTDGEPVSARIPIAPSATNLPVLTLGEATFAAAFGPQRDGVMGPTTGWHWICGDRRLSHRAAYRCRFKTWRGWWRARPRHVLEFDDGTTAAAWFGEGNHRWAFDGILRRSLSDDLAAVVFGIIVCVYLSEQDTST